MKTKGLKSSEHTELDSGYAMRLLLSLVEDMDRLRETAERMGVQIDALAHEHGVKRAA